MKTTPNNLAKATKISFAKFQHFRKNRGKFMQQMVGRFYSAGRSSVSEEGKASPLNLMYNAVTTLVPNLVYNDPRSKVRTTTLAFRDYGDTLELALNHLTQKIKLRNTLRLAIYDAIFMAGFVKTGLATSGEVAVIDGVDLALGQPYAERVDPDDMILDPMARAWDEQSFMGSRVRVDIDQLEQSGLYDMDAIRKLRSRYEQNAKGEAEKLTGTRSESDYDELATYVDLVELYIPGEQRIVTLPFTADGYADAFLREVEYDGPDSGPYHMLGFTPVGDNLMPIPPAAIWYDLHLMGNRIARKLARQAERLKRVLAYEGSAEEDVNQLSEADDGEKVRVEDVNKLKEITYGGAAPESYEWMDWVKRNFSEQAGSIDMLSGSNSNTPTATQAEILNANTSVRLGDMQGTVYQFTADIQRDLAFFLHTDPLIDLPLIKRVQGQEVQVRYTPEMKQGEFFDFTFAIQPFSMARPDPNTSMRRKMEFATNVIPAAAQAVMMLGPGFKIGAFLKRMAQEVQIEDADEWLNDEEFQSWIMMKLQATLASGDPGKAGAAMKMPEMGPVNPGQPNPQAYGPSGGVSPATEQSSMQQDPAADAQAANGQPSARDLALLR